ncbi:MAG: hypothetical protein E6I77_04265 [Chloroflexi bacterium]|nr:MAG: hypothetical protein E6I77_04265 [Chloroflexota bacterium]
MPRTRKPKQVKPPDDANLNTGADAPEAQEADAGGENRPSQLDQMRAALTDAPHREEPAEDFPEVPQPEEEAEPPAHIDEPAAAAAEPEAQATSSGLAVGLVLVVVGIFFLIMRLFEIDLSSYGWPLYVIIPGLTLLIVGFVSLGTGALVPGGIVTVTGLILAAQNATGDWASWAYAWTLVVPGGAGLGLFLQGLRVHDPKQVRLGRNLMFWSGLMFMIGFVIFESIFNISGQDFGIVSRAALPVLLIIIGVTLLARSVQRGRSA